MKNAKRLIAFLLVFSMAFAMFSFTGCGKKEEPAPEPQEEPEPEPEPEPEEVLPDNINYLTGAPLEDGATHTRPAAIVVENSYDARPQWGMDDPDLPPDIILEGEVEYQITRTLWFYDDYTKVPNKVGPMRSARPPFIKFSELFDAIFVHWGMSHSYAPYVGADEVFEKDKVDHINEMGNGSFIFGRDDTRDVSLEHTGILYGDQLAGAIKDLGFRTEINKDVFSRFRFNEEFVEPSTGDCTTLTFRYSGDTDTTTWTYLPDEGVYTSKNYENNVKRDNLIVLFDTTEYVSRDNYYSDGTGITYCNYLLTGGKGVYANKGKYQEIQWEIQDGKFTLLTTDGEKLFINPGRAWIGWGSENHGGEVTTS